MDGLWILVALIVLGAFAVIMLYNRLVAGRNQIENAWGQIDVQLKRRHDLIPNLVEVAKDYMGYEQETLQQVIDARSRAMGAGGSREATMQAESALSAALGRFFAVAESYPDLKANDTVSRLMEELASTENRIAFARQHYNDSVQAQNVAVESFPSNLVAKQFGFGKHVYFDMPEAEKAPVKVDLR
ncbi:MAG TPA: LemA family protein [Alphaproteobacteria bacterium]